MSERYINGGNSMSYEKMMKRTNGHRHDRDFQPMLFSMSGENIESLASISRRLAESYNVRVRQLADEEFTQVSSELATEDDAVKYCRDNDLDNKYKWVRIYNDKGQHVSGW